MYYGLGILAGQLAMNRLQMERLQREMAESLDRTAALQREYYGRDAIDVEARVVEDVLLLAAPV